MEHWAHASNNRYTLREMSRLQQDLSGSPHQQSLAIEIGDHQPMIRRALPKGRVPHVCIVGAGVAGLRCADTLLQHGVKVTIIEGRDRVGGRVYHPLLAFIDKTSDDVNVAMSE
jgi:NADPH-dependent 2,4-dienoyl-CoA reductase/sulfur reductase-like enzyme